MSKRIVYVGLERCDFVYHLAAVLSLKGSVLVADNSILQDLIKTVCKEDDCKIHEWRNITFVSNIDVNASDTECFDYILIYAGLNPCNDDFDVEDVTTLIMPDYTDHTLSVVENLPLESLKNPIYIMRDFCTKKLTDKSIAKRFNIDPKAIAGHIFLTVSDIANYVALSHNRYQNVKVLSDAMIDALTYVIAKFFETDIKKAAKMVSDTRKLK